MKERITIEHISGVEGGCLAIEDTRVAGPKPWGGGKVIKSWKADAKGILDAIGATKEFESLRASAAEKDARIAELESGLDWLVTLKRIKDTEGKTDKYTRNQPKAWANAQRLLSTPTGAKERVEEIPSGYVALYQNGGFCWFKDNPGKPPKTHHGHLLEEFFPVFRKRAEGRKE